MAIEKPEIKNLNDIFTISSLKIPYYQRPYIWGEKSVTILYNDTYKAYKSNQNEYRLGTIILHNDKNKNEFNIVDGQQRLISLALLLSVLGESTSLLDEEVNNISKKYIKTNHIKLKKLLAQCSLTSVEKNKYLEYIKTNCTFVEIVIENIEEAFQFFDSQNSRGKTLAPHDLLKAYHLREMNNLPENEKEDIINQWESIDDKKLKELFEYYLYPAIKWYKGENGLYYNSKKIDNFKGIRDNFKYNYTKYHIFSNMFVEKYKKDLSNISYDLDLNQFQLTQPIIAGERFFKYIIYYNKLLDNIIDKVNKTFKENEVPANKAGDKYIKQLYLCALLFFADRFNIESLEKNYMYIIYKWSYALRLVMNAVKRESVNQYASNKHGRLNKHKSIFKDINNMMKPEDIINIKLMNLDLDNDVKCKNEYIIKKYNESLNKEV